MRWTLLLAITLLPWTVWANPEKTFTLPGGATIEMVWIEPGTFIMGSPESEDGRDTNEGPQHEVTITRGFWLGKYELAQEQFESVTKSHPWSSGRLYVAEGPNYPAAYISWDDMQYLIGKLNEFEEAEIYRLPTEAEWEYACRAGATTRWAFGDDESLLREYAWYEDNGCDEEQCYAHEVGTKLPNPWGLCDMHGNVWEWVQDWYAPYTSDPQIDPVGPTTGSERVYRGGFFKNTPRSLRSASRAGLLGRRRLQHIGGRLLRVGPAPGPTTVSPASWGEIKAKFR